MIDWVLDGQYFPTLYFPLNYWPLTAFYTTTVSRGPRARAAIELAPVVRNAEIYFC